MECMVSIVCMRSCIITDTHKRRDATGTVVTSASHDLALVWLPVSSSSSPLLSLSLFRRYITPNTELITARFSVLGSVTGTEAIATITNAACAFVLPTPVTAGTITSLPATDYNLPSSVVVGPGCGTDLGQAPCPTPNCGDNLGEIPCSSALPPTTTTSINWDTTVTAPLQATGTGCNDVEECDENENNDRPS